MLACTVVAGIVMWILSMLIAHATSSRMLNCAFKMGGWVECDSPQDPCCFDVKEEVPRKPNPPLPSDKDSIKRRKDFHKMLHASPDGKVRYVNGVQYAASCTVSGSNGVTIVWCPATNSGGVVLPNGNHYDIVDGDFFVEVEDPKCPPCPKGPRCEEPVVCECPDST